MAASNSAINVAAAMLAAALLLSCAAPTSAQTPSCNSPKMCDDNCDAATVVHECIEFIGNLEGVPDLDTEAINGKLTFRRLQAVTGNIEFDGDDYPLPGVRR